MTARHRNQTEHTRTEQPGYGWNRHRRDAQRIVAFEADSIDRMLRRRRKIELNVLAVRIAGQRHEIDIADGLLV